MRALSSFKRAGSPPFELLHPATSSRKPHVQRLPPKMQAWTQIVKVCCGTHPPIFVHPVKLRSRSPYFKAALDWREGDGPLEVSTDFYDTFATYCQWIYDESFDPLKFWPAVFRERSLTHSEKITFVAKLWVMADYFQDLEFSDHIIAHLACVFDGSRERWMEPSTVSYVMNRTLPNSALRRLYVDQAAKATNWSLSSDLPQDFLTEILTRMRSTQRRCGKCPKEKLSSRVEKGKYLDRSRRQRQNVTTATVATTNEEIPVIDLS